MNFGARDGAEAWDALQRIEEVRPCDLSRASEGGLLILSI